MRNDRLIAFLKQEILKLEEQAEDYLDEIESLRNEIKELHNEIETYKHFKIERDKITIDLIREQIIKKRKLLEKTEELVIKMIEIIANKKSNLSWLQD